MLVDLYMAGMGSTTARRLEGMGLGRAEFPGHQEHRMKLGLVLGNEYTARMPATPRIDALIAQTRAARDLGFDGVYAGQHYVTWPLQCIQPIPLLARIAAEAGEMIQTAALAASMMELPT